MLSATGISPCLRLIHGSSARLHQYTKIYVVDGPEFQGTWRGNKKRGWQWPRRLGAGFTEPYQPAFPVICFDEMPYQMLSETRLPLPVRNGEPGRYDFEYRREGTCSLFMFLQPLAGWHAIAVADAAG
jgi:hypothetical protein